jgi:hypothetical protein
MFDELLLDYLLILIIFKRKASKRLDSLSFTELYNCQSLSGFSKYLAIKVKITAYDLVTDNTLRRSVLFPKIKLNAPRLAGPRAHYIDL